MEKYIRSEKDNWAIKQQVETLKTQVPKHKTIPRSSVQHILDMATYNLVINNVEHTDLMDIVNQLAGVKKSQSVTEDMKVLFSNRPFELGDD